MSASGVLYKDESPNKYGMLRFTFFLFLRYVAATLICLMTSLSVLLLINSVMGRVVCQLLNFCVLFSLPYGLAWQAGSSDRNKHLFGHVEEDLFKGLKAGLIACLPFFAAGVLLLLAKAGLFTSDFLYPYRLITCVFFPLNYSLLAGTLSLAEMSWGPVILSACFTLTLPVTPAFGYLFGYREISLHERVFYKNGNKKRRRA